MRTVAIIGSRTVAENTTNIDLVTKKLREICAGDKELPVICSGGASGGDTIAEMVSEEHQMDMIIYRAKWRIHDKKAGFLRNHDIESTSNECIAIIDKPLAESKGTAHTVGLFKKAGKPVHIIEVEGEKNV